MGWLEKLKSSVNSVFTSEYVKMKKVKIKTIGPRMQLNELRKKIESKRDKYGWVLGDCDAMLYMGLFGAVTEEKATVFNAQSDIVGKYFRRPGRECYAHDESKSSWSRDQGLGFIWWCYRANNRKALNAHFRYGQENGWKMGDGAISRILYTPQFIGLFDQARFEVNGNAYPDWKKKINPYIFPSGLDGYQAHLQVLIIALIGEINGKIPNEAFKRLKEHHSRKPSNPLYACVLARFKGGNIDYALRACMNPKIDDYAPHQIMRDIDTLFAIEYLIR